MKIKLRTLILAWVVILIALAWIIRTNAVSVKLTGGQTSVKSKSMWQLYQYRDVTLMRKAPMKWCPYLSYRVIHDHVSIEVRDNRYWFVVDTNVTKLLAPDATFNKRFAQSFKAKGNRKQKIRTIYKYCRKTRYTTARHTYAKDVFQHRQGDCAAIASAFYVLCKAKHIPVRYVIGWLPSGCHAWNMVKLKGKWWHVDCTNGWLLKKKLAGRKILEIW